MNISLIRKLAWRDAGREYFEPKVNPTSVLLLQKAASAIDKQLLKVASSLPGDTLSNYEALGGTYKIAELSPKITAALQVLGATGLIAAGATGGVLLGMGKKNRQQLHKEVRDPRLYSNLRGGVTFESPKERVKARKGLGKGDGTVLSAMRTGFGRKKD